MMISPELKPVFRRPAIEHQLQPAETDALSAINPNQSKRGGGIVTCLVQKQKHARCGDDPDRHIDVEHPAPGNCR